MKLTNKTARIISTSLLVAISLSANQIGLAAQSVAQPTPAKAAPLQTVDNLVNNWLKRPELQHSFVGVEILELPSGKELFAYNSRKRFAPASTTKVLTTACAYATLGGAYTYKTRVVADGKIAGDTLSGDLVIIPSQDPSFTRSDLQTMLSPVITIRLLVAVSTLPHCALVVKMQYTASLLVRAAVLNTGELVPIATLFTSH